MKTGLVFNIQRFSISDGPGIRTTVFMKGCNLRCQWCHNPESMNTKPQLQHFSQLCNGCDACIEVCQVKALHRDSEGGMQIDNDLCTHCGDCVDVCMQDAMVIAGKEMTSKDLVDVILKDKSFYEGSGGGVTFSGGEPMLQKDFLLEVMQKIKEHDIHISLDTAANVPWSHLEEVLPYVDLVLLDLKHMDGDCHMTRTKVTNGRILENAKKMDGMGVPILVRIPIIPTYNDSDKNIADAITYLNQMDNEVKVELLPYHSLGYDKNHSLDSQQDIEMFEEPSPDLMDRIKEAFCEAGIMATH